MYLHFLICSVIKFIFVHISKLIVLKHFKVLVPSVILLNQSINQFISYFSCQK